MTDYLYELKTVDARLFVMPSGALGIERGGIVTILPPAEWHDRVNAWLAEHHSVMAARREGNEIVGGMLAELRAQLATARQHDADQRATIAALEGEVGRMRGALGQIEAGNPGRPGKWLSDIEMADIARAALRATPATEGRDG